MSQSRRMSIIETVADAAIGVLVALVSQITIYPLLGVTASMRQNLAIVAIFTVISMVRKYAVRRLFNWLHSWSRLS